MVEECFVLGEAGGENRVTPGKFAGEESVGRTPVDNVGDSTDGKFVVSGGGQGESDESNHLAGDIGQSPAFLRSSQVVPKGCDCPRSLR